MVVRDGETVVIGGLEFWHYDKKRGIPVLTEPRLRDAVAEHLRALFRQMLLIRTLDERCLRLQRQGRIAFYGASMGQEAATVGSASGGRFVVCNVISAPNKTSLLPPKA